MQVNLTYDNDIQTLIEPSLLTSNIRHAGK